MVIAIDFDGTCVTHAYPAIGKDIGAVPVLKELNEQGVQLILLTMRCDSLLDAAVKWFTDNGIDLWGIQKNPTQHTWTSSNKVYANIYIDDAALGCPLSENAELSNRPFVNWTEVRAKLVQMNVLSEKEEA